MNNFDCEIAKSFFGESGGEGAGVPEKKEENLVKSANDEWGDAGDGFRALDIR